MATPAASAAPADPFIGLRRFEMSDSALFFGRNEQSYELLRRLHALHFVAVIGPSGCGKSSLVRAGVLATLREGYLAENGPWKIVMLQPGADPVGAWKRQLTPYLRPGTDPDALLTSPAEVLDTSTGKIAILVDQFEELFQFGDRTGLVNEVETFVRSMLSTGAPDAKIHLLLTMRSEYLVRCALYPQLAEAINEGLYLVPRMTREQMRQAIVGPIKKAGAAITVALIDRLLDDARRDEDGLPVLQHALMRMWPKRDPFAPLGLDAYSSGEGLDEFLDKHAEQVYESLTDEEKPIAEALFRCITERTPEGRSVRRAQQIDAIAAQTGYSVEQLRPVIARFADEGFLVTSQSDLPLVDISHEAVARQWKRLGSGIWEERGNSKIWVEGWMVLEARERRAVSRLREGAAEWERSGHDKSYLFRGPQLSRLELDVGRRRNDAGEPTRSFLAASKKADLLDRLFSGKALLAIGLGLGLVVAVIGFVTYQRSLAAEARSQASEAQSLASTAESEATQARAALVVAANEALVAQTELAQEDPRRQAQPAGSKARIYSQVWTEAQEKEMQPVLETLRAKGYLVPAVERVSVGPAATELRYFRTGEKKTADAISDILRQERIEATTRYVPGFEKSEKIRDNHFELWLARPSQAAAALTRPNVVVLYLDESLRDEAGEIGKAVSAVSSEYDVTVTPYRAVTWKFINPIELHYFHKEDQAEALRVTGRLQDIRAYYVQSRFMPVAQQIPLRYFEIWLQTR